MRDGDGWLVSLGGDFSSELTSPPLGGEWSGKGLELAVDLRLLSPAFSTVCPGVRDENILQGDEGSCLLQAGFVPSRYFIKHFCSASPVIYLKSNSYTPTTVHISNVSVREIPPTGLKPVLLPPEKKKLETGERIDLSWQGNGADIFPCPWSPGALQIDFLSLTSIVYAPLIPETAGRQIKLKLTMRSLSGSFSLEVALGDDTGETTQQNLINRKPCLLELNRAVGKNGYVRISGKTYGREKIILEKSFIEGVD